MVRKLSSCHLTTNAIPNEIVQIPKSKMLCYVSFVCSCGELFCVQPRWGMAWRLCVEGMPCNSDLYVYLNIEGVSGLVLRSQVVL